MPKVEKIAWVDVDSTNVKSVFHSDKTDTVFVKFHNGGLYAYMGVNEEVYMGLAGAVSVGQYLHRVLKAYPYTRYDTEADLLDYLNI